MARDTPSLAVRSRLILAIVVLAAFVSLPWWGGSGGMRLAVEFSYYVVLAQLWNLLAGYAGVVSIGQQAWVGMGGYFMFIATTFLGFHPLLAMAASGIVCAVVAIPTAWVLFRLRGAYFAIGSWVMAEAFRLSFAQVSATGGGSGMSLPVGVVHRLSGSRGERELVVYAVGVLLAVLAVVGVWVLMRTRLGLALAAIRDSDRASGSIGIATGRVKLLVYLVAAFGTGIAGGLVFLEKLRISPDSGFAVIDWTANVIFIVVIGGIGTVEGPIVGAALFFLLREMLADFGVWYLIVLGLVGVVMMLVAPQGIWGLLVQWTEWRMFPTKRVATDSSVSGPGTPKWS